MKARNRFLKLAAAAFALCAGLAAFAQDERWSQIPDGAALVINLNLGKLYSSATFKAVAESGDVEDIRDDLKAIPWNKAGTLPDPIIVYAPRMDESYAMLVGTDKTPEELAKDISARYGKQRTVESEKTGLGQMIRVKKPHKSRKTQQIEMRTDGEILYLTPRTVAFGRDKHGLDLPFFKAERLPASTFATLQNMPADTVAAGLLLSFPLPAADDPTGLSALVESGDFVVSEYAPGSASLVLNLECKGEKEAELAAKRLKSFIKITLVSLFSLYKDLFKELNSSYTTTSTGNKTKLVVKLPKSSLDRVRSYYLMEQALLDAAGGIADAIGAALK